MTDNNHHDDDLTVIRGIGKNRAQWLRNSLDVRTLRDLSTMSPETIEARLKAEGFITSRAKIESWIAQAKEFLAETAQEKMPKKATISNQSGTDQPSGITAWRPRASFVVEYETRQLPDGTEEKRSIVHHIESDQEMSWDTAINESLAEWMQAHVETGETAVGEGQPAEKSVQPVELTDEENALISPERDTNTDHQLEIVQIKAFQPAGTAQYTGSSRSGQPFLGSLKSGETFALEASFKLKDEFSKGFKDSQVTLSARFDVYDTQSGEVTHLGTTPPSRLQADGDIPRAMLQATRLTKGLYRLRIYGTLEGEISATGYLEVPYVQVT